MYEIRLQTNVLDCHDMQPMTNRQCYSSAHYSQRCFFTLPCMYIAESSDTNMQIGHNTHFLDYAVCWRYQV